MTLSTSNVTRSWEVDSKGGGVYSMRVDISKTLLATQMTVPNELITWGRFHIGSEVERRMRRDIMQAIERALFGS